MIHNIPVQYTKEMLLAEWRNNGTYDLFYLPWNPKAQCNLSYAFLNCTSEAAALVFAKRWDQHRLPYYSSRKPLSISSADVQGLDVQGVRTLFFASSSRTDSASAPRKP